MLLISHDMFNLYFLQLLKARFQPLKHFLIAVYFKLVFCLQLFDFDIFLHLVKLIIFHQFKSVIFFALWMFHFDYFCQLNDL